MEREIVREIVLTHHQSCLCQSCPKVKLSLLSPSISLQLSPSLFSFNLFQKTLTQAQLLKYGSYQRKSRRERGCQRVHDEPVRSSSPAVTDTEHDLLPTPTGVRCQSQAELLGVWMVFWRGRTHRQATCTLAGNSRLPWTLVKLLLKQLFVEHRQNEKGKKV